MNAPLSEVVYLLRSSSSFVYARGGPRIVGIEVKSGATLRYSRGMDAFRAKHSVDTCLVVGGGGVPLDEFLSEPAEHWLRRR